MPPLTGGAMGAAAGWLAGELIASAAFTPRRTGKLVAQAMLERPRPRGAGMEVSRLLQSTLHPRRSTDRPAAWAALERALDGGGVRAVELNAVLIGACASAEDASRLISHAARAGAERDGITYGLLLDRLLAEERPRSELTAVSDEATGFLDAIAERGLLPNEPTSAKMRAGEAPTGPELSAAVLRQLLRGTPRPRPSSPPRPAPPQREADAAAEAAQQPRAEKQAEGGAGSGSDGASSASSDGFMEGADHAAGFALFECLASQHVAGRHGALGSAHLTTMLAHGCASPEEQSALMARTEGLGLVLDVAPFNTLLSGMVIDGRGAEETRAVRANPTERLGCVGCRLSPSLHPAARHGRSRHGRSRHGRSPCGRCWTRWRREGWRPTNGRAACSRWARRT
jgi:hypothetical protein